MKKVLVIFIALALNVIKGNGQSWQCQTISPETDVLIDILGISPATASLQLVAFDIPL